MQVIKLTPLARPIQTELSVPGSLTYTIRALALAAMTQGSVKIINPLKSDDIYAMTSVLQTLGIHVEEGDDYFVVHGDISHVEDKQYEVNIRQSGRTARIILAILSIIPGEKIIRCHENFEKRPVKDLVDGLRQLGAEITYLKNEGHLPVKISSHELKQGLVQIKGNISSQYISAMMMIAPIVGNITIEAIGEQASKPFIDITIDIMKTFGVDVVNDNYRKYRIRTQKYVRKQYVVESDIASASYFWAIAAITKSTIKIVNINPDSKQGEIRFVDYLEKMGCRINKNDLEDWIEIEGTEKLRGIEANMKDEPDIVPTLAVVAAFTKGTTYISGISHLKVKESDRIEVPKKELEKLGVIVESTEKTLTITGGKPHGGIVETHGDHRIAMAFAVMGAKNQGIEISDPEVVNKSFPGFWDTIKRLGMGVEYV